MKQIAEKRPPFSNDTARWSITFVLVASGLCSLNFIPVSNSMFAPAIAIAVALAATGDPYMWFFYVAASQVVADPPAFPLTLSQIGVAAWLCSVPFRRSWPSLRDIEPFLRYVAPCVLWYYLASLLMRHSASTDIITGVVVGAIAYGYAIRDKVKPHALLLFLVLGTSFSMLGYWGIRFGLPMISEEYKVFVAGAHILREGGGRGDSNLVGENISVLIIGIMALASFRKFWASGSSRYLDVLWIAGLVAGVPVLLLTYARSALAATSIGAVFLLITTVLAHRSAVQTIRTVVLSTGILVAVVAIFVLVLGESPAVYQQAIEGRINADKVAFGGGILSGRMNVWQSHLKILRVYPVAGAPAGTAWDMGQYGILTAGTDDWDKVCAHNVFLDFGSKSGLPGLVLFIIVFFRAPIALVRRRGLGYAGPFICVLVVVFIAFFNYSAGSWKFYWALLALIIYAARYRERRYQMAPVIARLRLEKTVGGVA